VLSNTRSTHASSPAPGVIPDTIMAPGDNGPPAAGDRDVSPAATDRETRRERSRRKAHRSRLHGYAILTVVLVSFLIALAASNTARVKVNWVFGSSHVSLVWLMLFAAILGWLLGLLATAAFHWRTRAPRRSGGTS
jgi:uncharacterized integral membrane protein